MSPPSSQLLAPLRRTLAPALWSLRAYWGTAALLAATAAAGLAALLPVTSLVAPGGGDGGGGGGGLSARFGLPPWQGGDLGMSWSTLAWSPTVTQRAALGMLFRLLVGVAAGVIAVAGLTVMSLSAARASARAPDVSLRRAVGASRRQLMAAGLLEGGAIAAGALVVGALLGTAAGRLAVAGWPAAVGAGALAPNALAVVVALAGPVIGAVLPLLLPRRASPLPSAGGKPLELFVPALQLGLSLTVLTAAGLLQREAGRLVVPGRAAPDTGRIFRVTAPEPAAPARAAQYRSLLERLEGRPGIEAASLTSPGTLVGLGMVDVVTTDCGNCWQGGLAYQLQPVPAAHYLVSADTFGVLGLPLVAGRGIAAADRWGARRVAVVNQSLAARHFQEGAAVGRQILIGGAQAAWYTVVGVVRDQRPTGFGGGLQPRDAVYLSVLQHPAPSVELLVRAPADPGAIAAVERGLRDTLGARGSRVVRVTAAQVAAAEAAPVRWFARMFAAEAWVILALATLGTFLVMQLWVASLRYELGVRRAVGARRRDVLGFVLSRAAGVAIGGIAIGLWVGLFAWGTLATVVAGLPPWDFGAAARLSPLLVGATLAGALMPAWRAARAQPARYLIS